MQKLTGFLIGGFYLVTVAFSTVCLATGQFRSSGGSDYDTWRLNFNSNSVLKEDLDQQLKKVQKAAKTNWEELKMLEYCQGLFDKSGKLLPDVEARTKLSVEAVRIGAKKIEELHDESYCVVRGLSGVKYEKSIYEKRDKDFNEEILNLKMLLAANKEQYSDLVKEHHNFMAFNELGKDKYTKWLVIIPYDLLVLFLVMSMGTLGGMIRILRDYGAADQTSPSTKDYFLIPLIGSIIAIGGYILAKTGLLLLSSTKGETSLSPFMIGLVGMISGLLAKEVIDQIAVYGRSILKGKNGGQS